MPENKNSLKPNNNKHIRKDRYDGIAGFKMMVKRDVRAPIVYSLNAGFFIWTLFTVPCLNSHEILYSKVYSCKRPRT